MKLKYYSIPLVAVLLCVVFAVAVRFSYTNAGDKIYDYNFVSGGDMTDLFKTNKITSSSDLMAQSDVIVKAKYIGERKVTSDAFYSNVKVLNVYKGDQTIKGANLCVIEPLAVFTQNKFVNASRAFLIPLQPDGEYLLCLKHMQFDSARTLDSFQKSQYYPVTQGAFGCYRFSNKNQTKIMDDNKTYTINSLKGLDIFTDDRKVLNTYNQYKEQIFSRLGIR